MEMDLTEEKHMDKLEGDGVADLDEMEAEESASSEESATDSEDGDDAGEDEEEEQEDEHPQQVYLPGDAEDAEKSRELVCDESAYAMYHTCGTRKL